MRNVDDFFEKQKSQDNGVASKKFWSRSLDGIIAAKSTSSPVQYNAT